MEACKEQENTTSAQQYAVVVLLQSAVQISMCTSFQKLASAIFGSQVEEC